MSESMVCLNDEEIQHVLSGETGATHTSELEQHLVNCNDCRQRLEHTVGDEGWWNETETSLRSVIEAEGREPSGDAPDGFRPSASILDLLGPTDDPNMLGRIGPYEITGLLGQGGMGAVFKGFDRSLNRFVAIKMLLPHLAASGAARKRFAREGQAVAAVVDDHVMAIHCVDEWQGIPYLVMTYSRGVSLQKRLSDNGSLEVREILRIGMQAAKGLAAAHGQGIVHRDIKPANILLDQNVERVQLMDFGLARAVDDASLTRSGTLAGTPQYMSPEQARAETVDHRSDLFSLGSVLYALCIGHAPFRAESSYSVLRLITDKEPRPIREVNPDVPEWLCAIIGKLMSKQAEERYSSADEVADLLEDCLAHVQQPTTTTLPAPVAKLAKSFGSPSQTSENLGAFRRPPIGKLIAAAAFAFSLVFAGVLIVLEMNKGTLTIESDADDVPVRIMKEDTPVRRLTVSTSGESIRIAAGDYRIELDGSFEGLTVRDSVVTLSRGDDETVRIVHSDQSPKQAQARGSIDHDSADAFVSDITAKELEKQIRLRGRELLHGRLELAIEYETLWPTNDNKRERITSLGTARWLQKPGLMRIESDRMAAVDNSVKLHREQWTTGFDGSRTYSWNRSEKSIRYGKLRKGALAYAPNLFFWGRSETAYAHSMFGPNPKIQPVTRDGNREWDVLVEDSVSGVSLKYVGISPLRGFLPTLVESRAGKKLQGLIELDDFFQPRTNVWAAKTIHWTLWSDQDDADGNRIVTARTKFTVTRLELGDDAELDDAEFSLSLPKDTHNEEDVSEISSPTKVSDDAAPDSQTKSVDFVLGKTNLANGDQIEIQSVTTTGTGFEVGAMVTVKGTCTLNSEDAATLAFFSTQLPGETPTPTPVQPSQKMKAKRGKHTFTLSKVIGRIGSPHVSFYHPTTGQGMGGVYFSERKQSASRSTGKVPRP